MKPILQLLAAGTFSCVLAASLSRAENLPKGPQEDTVISCDDLVAKSTGNETVTECEGHVVVTGTNLKMVCDHLHVISTRSGDKTDTVGKQDQLKYILATGHVDMTQGDREATCGRAEILPQETKITLTESPVVVDHGNNTVTRGDELDMWNNERRVSGKHVRIEGPPMKDLGFDKRLAPPVPDAPPAHLAPAGPQP